MIPKIIHMAFYGEPAPEWAIANVMEFRALNPDYAMRWSLTVPNDLPDSLSGALKWTKDWRFRSDLIRYWLLYRDGGIWVDVDCRPIRPFDNDLLDRPAFLASYHPRAKKYRAINNFFCGCEPGAPAFSEAMRRALIPSMWNRKGRFFAVENTLLDAEYEPVPGLDVLPHNWVRARQEEEELHELISREPLAAGPEYLKHYGTGGLWDQPEDERLVSVDHGTE